MVALADALSSDSKEGAKRSLLGNALCLLSAMIYGGYTGGRCCRPGACRPGCLCAAARFACQLGRGSAATQAGQGPSSRASLAGLRLSLPSIRRLRRPPRGWRSWARGLAGWSGPRSQHVGLACALPAPAVAIRRLLKEDEETPMTLFFGYMGALILVRDSLVGPPWPPESRARRLRLRLR